MLDKKGILNEIDRLKNLERHANRLAEIQLTTGKVKRLQQGSLDAMDRVKPAAKMPKNNFKKECKCLRLLSCNS